MPLSPPGFASGAPGGAEGAVAAGGARGRAGRGRSVPGWAGRRPAGCRAVLWGAERCCRCCAGPWGPPLHGGGRDGAAWVPAVPTACGTPVSECRRPPSAGGRAPLTLSRSPRLRRAGLSPEPLRCPCPVPCPRSEAAHLRAAPAIPQPLWGLPGRFPPRPSPSAAPGLLRGSPRRKFSLAESLASFCLWFLRWSIRKRQWRRQQAAVALLEDILLPCRCLTCVRWPCAGP